MIEPRVLREGSNSKEEDRCSKEPDVVRRHLCRVTSDRKKNESESRSWSTRSMLLAAGGALGAAFAGSATALTGNTALEGWSAAIVLVAFLGAGLSGAAAAVGAPKRANDAWRRSVELGALARRLEVIIDYDRRDIEPPEGIGDFLKATLDQLDKIYGAEKVPEELQIAPRDLAKLYDGYGAETGRRTNWDARLTDANHETLA
jgi:hypothetical protein